MTEYTAIFDRYVSVDTVAQIKIILKHLSPQFNNSKAAEEFYIDANDVPFLIGALTYGESISFKCKNIENNQIIKPIEIKYKTGEIK